MLGGLLDCDNRAAIEQAGTQRNEDHLSPGRQLAPLFRDGGMVVAGRPDDGDPDENHRHGYQLYPRGRHPGGDGKTDDEDRMRCDDRSDDIDATDDHGMKEQR